MTDAFEELSKSIDRMHQVLTSAMMDGDEFEPHLNEMVIDWARDVLMREARVEACVQTIVSLRQRLSEIESDLEYEDHDE